MRRVYSLLSFIIAFTLSLILSLLSYSFQSSGPGFTKEEASQKLGRRVSYVAAPDGEMSLKRGAHGEFAVIPVGARGTIRGMEELPSGKYFIVVEWDGREHHEPWRSWFGKDYQQAGIIEE